VSELRTNELCSINISADHDIPTDDDFPADRDVPTDRNVSTDQNSVEEYELTNMQTRDSPPVRRSSDPLRGEAGAPLLPR
jgi:hypothetical protein